MKILYVITNSFWYGDNIALFNLMPHLIEGGVEPLFLVPKDSIANERFSEFTKLIIPYNVSNILYTQKTTSSSSIIKNYISSVKCVLKSLFADNREYEYIHDVIKQSSPELIHTNNSGCVLGYKLANSLNIPHVWHIREYGDKDANWLYFPSREYVMHRFNNKLNYNITITEGIRKYFRLSKVNTQTIYDGPICCRISPDIARDKPYFLFVGRLFPNKGVEMLIEAMSKVIKHRPYTILRIAGSGEASYVSYIRNKTKELGLINNVEFLGYRHDIAELMSHAKAVIVPSFFEAFGFITTEAMFYGAVVIGYDSAGTKEQMDNVENALGRKVCLRFSNTNELADVILNAIDSDLDRNVLKDVSNFVLKTYSDVESARKVFEFYLKIKKTNIK